MTFSRLAIVALLLLATTFFPKASGSTSGEAQAALEVQRVVHSTPAEQNAFVQALVDGVVKHHNNVALPVQAVPSDDVEVVVAHYNEDLSWLSGVGSGEAEKRATPRFSIYTKSPEYSDPQLPSVMQEFGTAADVRRLPNVGREAHTYLSHIVNKYDGLAQWTVFTQGGKPSFGYMGPGPGGGHLTSGDRFENYLKPHASGSRFIYTAVVQLPSMHHALRVSYCINDTSVEYSQDNSISECPVKDSLWTSWWDMGDFKHFIQGKVKEQNGLEVMDFYNSFISPSNSLKSVTVAFTQGGRFAVSRENILRWSKAHYERLLATLSHDVNPYSGFFMEWMWSELFLGHKEPCNMGNIKSMRVALKHGWRRLHHGGVSGGVSGGISDGVITLTEHTASAYYVAFNPDGGLLASGGWYRTVKVFATSTWAEMTRLTEHTDAVLSVAFNPGGGLLVSGSSDHTVKVFATSTWAEGITLAEHTDWVYSVAFSPGGGLLASGSGDYTVKVFATSPWAEVTTLTAHTDRVESVAFNPDGGLLASGSLDKTVKVFATSTWAEVTRLRAHHTDRVVSVAFSPDGGLLASGSWDFTVKVFATSTWAEVTTLTEHTDYVSSMAFNPDGGLLASGSWDNTVKVFATSTWAEVTTHTEHTDVVCSVAFNPGGGLLASGSYDYTVKVFATSTWDLWGPDGSVSFSVCIVDAGGLGGADPSVESCSEGAFQSSDMQNIMTIGIVEHWFIKPSDITPGPKSILGSGSFGIVVKGMLNNATEVAIKIPKTQFQSREESQLANEMRLFRHIRHSNIVLFHGATLMVINGGSPCLGLVLEWVDGGNFGEYMQQLRSNAVFGADGHAFAYKILVDVARGMTYLHKLTPVILHLDLKPANILVEKLVPPKGKITDFGLSRFARNSLPQPKVGTEKYMAPEVAQRKPYGPAADVFSFGRVIIWTITGELCPELISLTSFKGQEDACLFQTLDEVASSCLEEEPHMRPHFFQVYDRLPAPPPTTTTTTKIVPPPPTTTKTKTVL
ncbi:unnamed protein product [Polarella glacialis]|uniref:Protein kinase domain-containing protein n=1 Tax=Polarella glacialis TaxID=89957 RepID=A0A813KLZ2_POLGL|nr:unnamed protein product [Polarella glacialis]